MKFMTRWGLALLPALAVATPALAYPPPQLSDSQQPGSVIIYPKWVSGTVHADGIAVPQTEIEIGAVCPPAFVNGGGFCPEHQSIKLRFHWVCPGTEGVNSNICPESDFEVFISVNGKLAFSASGVAINANSPPLVPPPPCARGYLIGWVINPANDLPVKYDGLIGNAVIRGGDLPVGHPQAGASTAISAYNAVTIQADPALVYNGGVGPAITTGPTGGLIFDGAPGHYTEITGVQIGDVKYDKTVAGLPLPDVFSKTALTFLTLDVASSQPNNPTFINLDFYNESLNTVSATNPTFEHLTSSFLEFVCWIQIPIASLPSGAALTQNFQTTRKGIVLAGPAVKESDGNAPNDHPIIGSSEPSPYPVTLIGLVETVEGTALGGFLERKYNFNMDTDGFPVATTFLPLPRRH